jgi:vanillate monooxygenase
MFLMNQWYAAALPDELTAKPMARQICGEHIALFRTASGRVAALEDRCAHRYAPLSAGVCIGENIRCPYHGIVFDASGACVDIPQQPKTPARMQVRAYPLVERWGWAWIWMGDPALADPAAIPNYWWFGDPKWKSFQRHFHAKAGWLLCTDNILDLSHTPYVHTGTVGTPEMARIPVKTWMDGDKVINRRIMKQVTPGPFVYGWGNFTGSIDRVTTTEWCPASNTAVELYYEDHQARITLRLTNPLTPETERTTHCWFAWSRDFGSDSTEDEYAVKFRDQSINVQMEDLAMIEMQQRVVDRGGPMPTVAINADATLIQARRVIDRLLDEAKTDRRKRSA